MQEINELPEGFIPNVTITIQVRAELDNESGEIPGSCCFIEGEISRSQWCGIFDSFGGMVANEFTSAFGEFLKAQPRMSDKEKRAAYTQFCKLQMVHMIGHLQESFQDVAKEYIKSLGKSKDMQA